jgi:hypothetical protein
MSSEQLKLPSNKISLIKKSCVKYLVLACSENLHLGGTPNI